MKRSKARNGYARHDIGRLWGPQSLKDRMRMLRETTGASNGALMRFALSRMKDEDVLDDPDTVRGS